MNQTITARSESLEEIIGLRVRYLSLSHEQEERISAITIGTIPDADDFVTENRKCDEILATGRAISDLIKSFPEYIPDLAPPQKPAKKLWFRKSSVDAMDTETSIDLYKSEVQLQDARLRNIVSSFLDTMIDHRTALHNMSYTVKKLVVELNQSSQYLPSEGGVRVIERERHRMEQLATLIDNMSSGVLMLSRTLEMLLDELNTAVTTNKDEMNVA